MTVMSRESEARMVKWAKDLRERKEPFFRPDVVESKVRIQFPIPLVAKVLEILSEYHAFSDQHSARVRLAVLKLSGGDFKKVRQEIDAAKLDFREVLLPAEEPGILRMRAGAWNELSDDEKEKLSNEDHTQYMDWILQKE